jgi:hypothetical protein
MFAMGIVILTATTLLSYDDPNWLAYRRCLYEITEITIKAMLSW